jgi:hypothetical protein
VLYALCIAAAVAMVSYALFGDYRFTFHSDGALKTILAREAWTEGRIVPRDWVYANGDLFFVGPQIFAELLYPFTGMSYLNNALADWLGYILVVVAALGVARAVIGHWRGSLLAAALVASGLCSASFEFTIAQGAYSVWAALALVLGGSVAVASAKPWAPSRFRWPWIVACACLAMVGAMCNPTRGVISIVLPVAAGWVAYVLFHGRGDVAARLRLAMHPVVIALLGGALIGYMVNRFAIMPHVANFNAAARVGISSPADMWKHIMMLPGAWFDYLRVGVAWPGLTPWRRALQLGLWLLAIAMLVSPMVIIAYARRYRPAVVAFAWMTLATYGIAIAALVIAPMLFLGTGELRYLTFGMMNSLVTVAAALAPVDALARGRSRVAACVAIFAAVLATQWTVESSPNASNLGGTYNQRLALGEVLAREKVGAFVSSYWYSHVITVLSRGQSEGYPITFEHGIGPFAHHMPRYVHQGEAGTRQAVVLDAGEATPGNLQRFTDLFGPPAKEIQAAPFVVLVYDQDIVSAATRPSSTDSPISDKRLAIAVSPGELQACAGCTAHVTVTNLGDVALTSAGALPLRVGVFAERADGKRLPSETRGNFDHTVVKGASIDVPVTLPDTVPEGTAHYRVCLVQETVAWHCEQTQVTPGH